MTFHFPFENTYARPPGPLLCPRRADARRSAAAYPPEPNSRSNRPRSGLARRSRGARGLAGSGCRMRQSRSRWPMPAISSAISCRSSGRPRDPVGRSGRPEGRSTRPSAQRLGPHPVFARWRWPGGARPGVARVHRERGDGGARHPDHAFSRRGRDGGGGRARLFCREPF